MATKQQVLDLRKKNPGWSTARIAAALDCCSAYVRATLRRNGFSTPRFDSIVSLGTAARDAGLTVADIQKLARRAA